MCGHFQDFPVASEPHVDQSALSKMRGATMLSTRLTTGLGGLFVVTALLFVVQLYNGMMVFPL